MFPHRLPKSSLLVFLGLLLAAPGRPAEQLEPSAPSEPSPAGACVGGAASVCLGDGRFRVDVGWFAESLTGAAEATTLGPDAAYFRSPGGAGLVVQVLDGRAVNGHFWVLSGGLSHASYSLESLEVTDLETGESRHYGAFERPLDPSGTTSDLQAFRADGSQAASAPAAGEADEAPAAGPPSLSLKEGRLLVEAVDVVEADGDRLRGAALAADSANSSGYFWSADPARPEMVVSVVDGRDVDGRYWILYGSPSGAAATLRISDTFTGRSFDARIAAGETTTHVLTQALLAPRSVTPTLDRTRSVSALVPVQGKTVVATSADGTVFTLIIPPGALLSEATITLTPVSAIGGLPFKPGLAGAVHLEPEGLRLFEFATLRIEPPAPVARAQEMTFAYRGTGQQFFLYPPSVNAAGVEMKILHFSGYGVAKGSLAEQTAQLQRPPTLVEDQLSQELQSIISQQRRGGKAAPTAESVLPRDLIRNAIKQAYYRNHKPNLTKIQTSRAAFKKYDSGMLDWGKRVELLLADQFKSERLTLRQARLKGLANAYNDAFGKCVGRRDAREVGSMLHYFLRLTAEGAGKLVDESKFERCARFDLGFESEVEESPKGGWEGFGIAYRMIVGAEVPLRFSGSSSLSGTAPLVWLSLQVSAGTFPIAGCGLVVQALEAGQLRAGLFIDANEFAGAPPPQISLEYNPPSPLDKRSMVCAGGELPVPFATQPFFFSYFDLHSDESTGVGLFSPLRARNWDFLGVGGAVSFLKTYVREKDSTRPFPNYVHLKEMTIMVLKHKPGP